LFLSGCLCLKPREKRWKISKKCGCPGDNKWNAQRSR
jgi:hypothetical protein